MDAFLIKMHGKRYVGRNMRPDDGNPRSGYRPYIWVKTVYEAEKFGSIAGATLFCRAHRHDMADVEILRCPKLPTPGGDGGRALPVVC